MGQEVHHLLPKEEGGPGTLDNAIFLCVQCRNWLRLATERTSDSSFAKPGMSGTKSLESGTNRLRRWHSSPSSMNSRLRTTSKA
jgi:5-methylcytosine-specific restriction endonuclease McrA